MHARVSALGDEVVNVRECCRVRRSGIVGCGPVIMTARVCMHQNEILFSHLVPIRPAVLAIGSSEFHLRMRTKSQSDFFRHGLDWGLRHHIVFSHLMRFFPYIISQLVACRMSIRIWKILVNEHHLRQIATRQLILVSIEQTGSSEQMCNSHFDCSDVQNFQSIWPICCTVRGILAEPKKQKKLE